MSYLLINKPNNLRKIYETNNLIKWGTQIIIYIVIYVLIYYYLCLFKNTIIDDAFITFNYSKSLKNKLVWGFYGDIISNTATSPLNVILTAISGFFAIDMLKASILLCALELTVMYFISIKMMRELYGNSIAGILIPIFVMVNPLIISTLGLESILYSTLMLISIYVLLKNKIFTLGIILGLLFLTREDGILFFLVILFIPKKYFFNKQSGRKNISVISYLKDVFVSKKAIKLISGYGMVIIPWLLFSWISLGSLVPETLFIKLTQRWDSGVQFFNGLLLYLVKYRLLLVFSILPLVTYLFLLFLNRKLISFLEIILLVFIALYFLSYSVLAVPPYHWYYVPVIFASILLCSLIIARITINRKLVIGFWTIIIVMILHSIGIIDYFKQNNFNLPQEAPIHTNWATQQQYKLIAYWLNNHVEKGCYIEFKGEIGTISYYCEAHLLDYFSIRKFSTDKIIQLLKKKGRVISILSNLNFAWYNKKFINININYRMKAYNYAYQIPYNKNIVKKWKLSSCWINAGVIYLEKVNTSTKLEL